MRDGGQYIPGVLCHLREREGGRGAREGQDAHSLKLCQELTTPRSSI